MASVRVAEISHTGFVTLNIRAEGMLVANAPHIRPSSSEGIVRALLNRGERVNIMVRDAVSGMVVGTDFCTIFNMGVFQTPSNRLGVHLGFNAGKWVKIMRDDIRNTEQKERYANES
jgi:hypothetical protein